MNGEILKNFFVMLVCSGLVIALTIPLIKEINQKIKEKDFALTLLYVVASFLLSRFLGIAMIIYTIVKWEKTWQPKTTLEPPEDPDPEPVPVKKVQVEDGYEKWKAERMKDEQ